MEDITKNTAARPKGRIWQSEATERKEYSLSLFARVRDTLLDVLTLENMPDKNRKQTQELLTGVERTLDLIRKS